MKILFYNWVQFEDPEKRGGGVSIYQKNLIEKLSLDRTKDIYFLSSGIAYNFFKQKTYCRRTLVHWNTNLMPDSPIRISIVILNYNRLEETRYTVERLRELIAGRTDTEVIAVDNGSSDGTACYLTSQADFLTPVILPDNHGVAGCTAGFERVKGDYILVLDDDLHPRDGTTLDRPIRHLDSDPETGAAACRIENRDGTRISHSDIHLASPQERPAGAVLAPEQPPASTLASGVSGCT
jgi:cellulose synthase/poly-beta-1,6-N-acetylglucosamine synthase-like glycosyltransferase